MFLAEAPKPLVDILVPMPRVSTDFAALMEAGDRYWYPKVSGSPGGLGARGLVSKGTPLRYRQFYPDAEIPYFFRPSDIPCRLRSDCTVLG